MPIYPLASQILRYHNFSMLCRSYHWVHPKAPACHGSWTIWASTHLMLWRLGMGRMMSRCFKLLGWVREATGKGSCSKRNEGNKGPWLLLSVFLFSPQRVLALLHSMMSGARNGRNRDPLARLNCVVTGSSPWTIHPPASQTVSLYFAQAYLCTHCTNSWPETCIG